MIKNETKGVVDVARQAVLSAQKFLESDTPAANITKTVLAIVALSPLIFVGAMAPNVIQILRPYMKKRKISSREVSRALDLLDRSGYLNIKRKDGAVEIHITRKGMKQAKRLTLETVKLSSSDVWDGKWRLLFYDVPVRHNSARLAFRKMIMKLGMYPLQKSLWVYPYQCEAEILFVANFFNVDDFVNFAVADSLFDQGKTLKFFGLVDTKQD